MFFAKFAAAAMVVASASAGMTVIAAIPAGAATAPAVHRGISGGGSSATATVTVIPRSCIGNPHGCPA